MDDLGDLEQFLRARLDEDRLAVNDTHDARCDALTCPCYPNPSPCDCGTPKRLASDVDAKRALIDWKEGDPLFIYRGRAYVEAVLKCLAVSYSDHPDYREEWRPEDRGADTSDADIQPSSPPEIRRLVDCEGNRDEIYDVGTE